MSAKMTPASDPAFLSNFSSDDVAELIRSIESDLPRWDDGKTREKILDGAKLVESRFSRIEAGVSLEERLEIARGVMNGFLNALFSLDKSPVYWGGGQKAQIISARIKSRCSIVGKIVRKIKKDERIGKKRSLDAIFDSLTDLVGARVVFTTADEAKKAGDFINVHFHVDDFNSGDKAESKSDTEFGYLSIHHIVILRGDFFNREHREALGYEESQWEKYRNIFDEFPLRLEIQTRSLLQHAWAEVAHNTIYKNNGMVVPPESKRRLNSIAAVLENADHAINDFMYLFNEQQEQSTEKYRSIAELLARKKYCDMNEWERHSLKALLFEINEFLKFHKNNHEAMLVKIMARLLLWDKDAELILGRKRQERASGEQLRIFKLKNRQDDILNTLMLLIRDRADVSLLKDFAPFDRNDSGRRLTDTIGLAIRVANLKTTSKKRFVFWACDTKQAGESVRTALQKAVAGVDLSDHVSICMIYPNGKGKSAEGRYQFDDADQLAKILPGSKVLFCNDIEYAGKDNWPRGVDIFDRTDNRRYSLFEPLHVLLKLGVDPREIKFIGYNLQRMENTLLRFALAVGADVLILKHPDMSRFRTIMRDSQWPADEERGKQKFEVREIGADAIGDFLKNENKE